MQQILIIHGGTSYDSYDHYRHDLATMTLDYERLKKKQRWSAWIAEQLPESDVLLPTFPNSANAAYEEWKVYFEKILPYLTEDVSLVGHSLGAMFLAKYLHTAVLQQRVDQVILISPCYNDTSNEELGSFGITSATGIERSTNAIHLFHSKDDPVVPFTEHAKFCTDLPTASSHVFDDREHFNQPTFPELLAVLRH